MAVDLNEISSAVRTYLDTKVAVTISSPEPTTGSSIKSDETFTFRVTAANANVASGGLALRNVKYRIVVENPAVAKIRVPPAVVGRATDLAGDPMAEGAEVSALIFSPAITAEHSKLGPGDTDTLTLTGKAGPAAGGGTTQIIARILADIDLDVLFPQQLDSPASTRSVVVGG
jgi:hypothetical protein